MICPKCKSLKHNVADTRRYYKFIIRVRVCECGYGWHTREEEYDMTNKFNAKEFKDNMILEHSDNFELFDNEENEDFLQPKNKAS